MLRSLSVWVIAFVVLVSLVNNVGLAESIVLESSAVNTIQIKAIERRGEKVFEIQLGGGSNQPPANTWISGKASTVVDHKRYSGFYRLSTDPDHQLKMQFKTAESGSDEYSFVGADDVLYFEFAPDSSFRNPWLTGRITLASASQLQRETGKRKKPDQNNVNQSGGNQNNGQNGNDSRQQGNEHSPIAIAGVVSASIGGSLAKNFESGESQLLLDVGGNQQLSVLQRDNALSGMSLQQGRISLGRK